VSEADTNRPESENREARPVERRMSPEGKPKRPSAPRRPSFEQADLRPTPVPQPGHRAPRPGGNRGAPGGFGGPNRGGPNRGGPNRGGPNRGGPNRGGPRQGGGGFGSDAQGQGGPRPFKPGGGRPFGNKPFGAKSFPAKGFGPKGFKPRAPGSRPHAPTDARTRFGKTREDRARDIRIIYEDDRILVVDKPPGLPVLGAKPAFGPRGPGRPGATPGAPADLLGHLRQQHGRRATRLFAVSRLDVEASGLVVFAKQEADFDTMKTEFARGKADLFFTAAVEGEIESEQGTIRTDLIIPRTGPVRTLEPGSFARDEEVAVSVTQFQRLGSGEGRTLVRLRMETNRRDQHRAHFASRGHPILGDRMYGNGRTHEGNPLNRLVLHASEAAFTHPGTGARQRVVSPAPGSFYKLIGAETPPRSAEADRDRGITPAQDPAPADEFAHAPDDRATETRPAETRQAPAERSWEHVAAWYDDLIADRRSDHYDTVIIPGVTGLLGAREGERVLDVACGQGVLAHELALAGATVVGVDASPSLIDAARARTPAGAADRVRFDVADARELPTETLGTFDAAACVMALMNIDRFEHVLSGVASALRPGGRFVAVILHPAFRAPGRTQWGWLEDGSRWVQFRRVDGYLSPSEREIVMNPGEAASGAEPVRTVTHTRSISAYVRALAQAGLVINAMEEWASRRESEPGPRAEAENTARREIPMFLAFRAIRPS